MYKSSVYNGNHAINFASEEFNDISLDNRKLVEKQCISKELDSLKNISNLSDKDAFHVERLCGDYMQNKGIRYFNGLATMVFIIYTNREDAPLIDKVIASRDPAYTWFPCGRQNDTNTDFEYLDNGIRNRILSFLDQFRRKYTCTVMYTCLFDDLRSCQIGRKVRYIDDMFDSLVSYHDPWLSREMRKFNMCVSRFAAEYFVTALASLSLQTKADLDCIWNFWRKMILVGQPCLVPLAIYHLISTHPPYKSFCFDVGSPSQNILSCPSNFNTFWHQLQSLARATPETFAVEYCYSATDYSDYTFKKTAHEECLESEPFRGTSLLGGIVANTAATNIFEEIKRCNFQDHMYQRIESPPCIHITSMDFFKILKTRITMRKIKPEECVSSCVGVVENSGIVIINLDQDTDNPTRTKYENRETKTVDGTLDSNVANSVTEDLTDSNESKVTATTSQSKSQFSAEDDRNYFFSQNSGFTTERSVSQSFSISCFPFGIVLEDGIDWTPTYLELKSSLRMWEVVVFDCRLSSSVQKSKEHLKGAVNCATELKGEKKGEKVEALLLRCEEVRDKVLILFDDDGNRNRLIDDIIRALHNRGFQKTCVVFGGWKQLSSAIHKCGLSKQLIVPIYKFGDSQEGDLHFAYNMKSKFNTFKKAAAETTKGVSESFKNLWSHPSSNIFSLAKSGWRSSQDTQHQTHESLATISTVSICSSTPSISPNHMISDYKSRLASADKIKESNQTISPSNQQSNANIFMSHSSPPELANDTCSVSQENTESPSDQSGSVEDRLAPFKAKWTQFSNAAAQKSRDISRTLKQAVESETLRNITSNTSRHIDSIMGSSNVFPSNNASSPDKQENETANLSEDLRIEKDGDEESPLPSSPTYEKKDSDLVAAPVPEETASTNSGPLFEIGGLSDEEENHVADHYVDNSPDEPSHDDHFFLEGPLSPGDNETINLSSLTSFKTNDGVTEMKSWKHEISALEALKFGDDVDVNKLQKRVGKILKVYPAVEIVPNKDKRGFSLFSPRKHANNHESRYILLCLDLLILLERCDNEAVEDIEDESQKDDSFSEDVDLVEEQTVATSTKPKSENDGQKCSPHSNKSKEKVKDKDKIKDKMKNKNKGLDKAVGINSFQTLDRRMTFGYLKQYSSETEKDSESDDVNSVDHDGNDFIITYDTVVFETFPKFYSEGDNTFKSKLKRNDTECQSLDTTLRQEGDNAKYLMAKPLKNPINDVRLPKNGGGVKTSKTEVAPEADSSCCIDPDLKPAIVLGKYNLSQLSRILYKPVSNGWDEVSFQFSHSAKILTFAMHSTPELLQTFETNLETFGVDLKPEIYQ